MHRASDEPPPCFADLDARIREGVAAVAHHQEDPRDPFRGLYLTDEQALALAAEGHPQQVDERLWSVATLLGLDALDVSVLAVCAAPELSWRYGRLYGYLHDDLTRQLASARLAAALLASDTTSGEQVLERLAVDAPLRRLGAIWVLHEPRLPIADRPLKIADALAAMLIGCAPARIDTSDCELVEIPALAPAPQATIAELNSVIATGSEVALAVAGADAPSTLAYALGRPLLLASAAGLDDPERLPSVRLAAALAQATLAFAGFERLAPDARASAWRALRDKPERTLVCVQSSDTIVALDREPVLVVRIPPASLPERMAAWSQLAPGCEIEEVATKFRLSIEQITRAARIAQTRARAQERERPSAQDLDHGARGASQHGLGGLASRVDGERGWESLIVPERALSSLRMISAFLRHRDRVLLDWDKAQSAPTAAGLTVLFAGESGTGKTMAARVVAGELGLDLYRIDLATVVSKYIGETEKNLDRIFAAAEGSNAILLFDEADALFGKRSEVHDAHDRYANVEVSYLLQRIEGYAGAVILTTNLRQNIDEAFLRRLDLLVDFPFPEVRERERLWQRLLPSSAAAERIDIALLAERFKLSGGSIRNASLAAALLAADEGAPLGTEHLLRAIALEYGKLGRLTLQADFESAVYTQSDLQPADPTETDFHPADPASGGNATESATPLPG